MEPTIAIGREFGETQPQRNKYRLLPPGNSATIPVLQFIIVVTMFALDVTSRSANWSAEDAPGNITPNV